MSFPDLDSGPALERLTWRAALLGIAVTVPLLVLVLVRTDIEDTRRVLAGGDYKLLALAMLLFAGSVWLQALRWRLLLRGFADVSLPRLYAVQFIGHMGNSLLPLRGGDILRVLFLSHREKVSRTATLTSVAVERIMDGLVLALILLVFLLFNQGTAWLRGLAVLAGLVFGLATLVVLALSLWHRRFRSAAEALLSRAPQKWSRPVLRLVDSFVLGLRSIDGPKTFVAVFLTTLAFWSTVTCIYFLVGKAFGLELGMNSYLLATAAGNLGLSVPSSQGGLGPFEFLVREALVLRGAPAAAATGYAIGLHLVLLIPMITIGLAFFWAARGSFRSLFSLQSPAIREPALRESAPP